MAATPWSSPSASVVHDSRSVPVGATVFSGAPSPARPSAGSSSADGLSCHSFQPPLKVTGCASASGFSSRRSTMPISDSGETRHVKRPGSSGVTGPLPLAAPPTKAEPRHSVPCASPSVKRPPVFCSTSDASQLAGAQTASVTATLATISSNHSMARFTGPPLSASASSTCSSRLALMQRQRRVDQAGRVLRDDAGVLHVDAAIATQRVQPINQAGEGHADQLRAQAVRGEAGLDAVARHSRRRHVRLRLQRAGLQGQRLQFGGLLAQYRLIFLQPLATTQRRRDQQAIHQQHAQHGAADAEETAFLLGARGPERGAVGARLIHHCGDCIHDLLPLVASCMRQVPGVASLSSSLRAASEALICAIAAASTMFGLIFTSSARSRYSSVAMTSLRGRPLKASPSAALSAVNSSAPASPLAARASSIFLRICAAGSRITVSFG